VSALRAGAGIGRDPGHLAAKVRLPHVLSLQRLGRPRTQPVRWSALGPGRIPARALRLRAAPGWR